MTLSDKPRVLVTGGAGYVGSHACKALARAGYLPVTFDSLERGHERAVKWGPLERGDLRNPDELKRAVNAAMDSGRPTLINAVIDPAAGSESGRIGNLNPQSKLAKKK